MGVGGGWFFGGGALNCEVSGYGLGVVIIFCLLCVMVCLLKLRFFWGGWCF